MMEVDLFEGGCVDNPFASRPRCAPDGTLVALWRHQRFSGGPGGRVIAPPGVQRWGAAGELICQAPPGSLADQVVIDVVVGQPATLLATGAQSAFLMCTSSGLDLIELRQCSGHQFVAASHVEAHRVLGRRGGDDNLGVAGVSGDQVQLVGQTTANARCAELLTDVEERELRDLGTKVWHDHSDPNQPSFRKGAECDPARVDVTLEGVPLRLDGVLAVPVWVPAGRAPVPAPLFEFRPMLYVDEVNALGTVDLGDLRQLYPR